MAVRPGGLAQIKTLIMVRYSSRLCCLNRLITGIVFIPNSLVQSPFGRHRGRPGRRGSLPHNASCAAPFAATATGRRRSISRQRMGCGSARHGGGVLPDTLPALTRQQSRPYVAESAAQWTRSPVRRTSRSSSSPWPPAAPRVAAPLVAAHAHVFVVRLITSHAAPLLRAAPALRGLHRRPQTACFGRGSTATTAAAVTGHAAAAGTVVLCVSMWNRTRSFLYTRGLVRL